MQQSHCKLLFYCACIYPKMAGEENRFSWLLSAFWAKLTHVPNHALDWPISLSQLNLSLLSHIPVEQIKRTEGTVRSFVIYCTALGQMYLYNHLDSIQLDFYYSIANTWIANSTYTRKNSIIEGGFREKNKEFKRTPTGYLSNARSREMSRFPHKSPVVLS